MKAFSFRLQRVLDYRKLLVDQAEFHLQQLIGQRHQLQNQLIENQKSQAKCWVTPGSGSSVFLPELQSSSSHRRALKKRELILSHQIQGILAKVKKQQVVVRQAQQNHQLLEKLKVRRYQEWQAELDRESEEIAADAYRSRLHSRRSLIEELKVFV